VKLRRRDERGQLIVGGGLILGLGVMLGYLAIGALQDLVDASSGRWHKPPETTYAGFGTTPSHFVGPYLPRDQEACAQQVAARYGLRWTGPAQGWRADLYPEPQATEDPVKDRGTLSAWQDQMASLTGPASQDWRQSCTRPDLGTPAPRAPQQTTEALAVSVDGVYPMTIDSTSTDASCTEQGPPDQLIVSGGGTRMVVRAAQRGSYSLAGTVRPDLTFDARVDDQGATVEVSGRFEELSQGLAVRGGIVRVTIPGVGSCSFDFTALRR
jgi:hypothetical protein